MAERERILFVDDMPNSLAALRRMLHSMRGQWDMDFALSGEKALALMEQRPFDMLVSDMQMPGVSGAELLASTLNLHPQTIRFALSDYSDIALVLTAVGLSHQFLAKPCQPDRLRNAITRALDFLEILKPRARALVSTVECLPILPEAFHALNEALTPPIDPDPLEKTIRGDLSLSAQILHLANLTATGDEPRILDIQKAITALKYDFLTNIFLKTDTFRQFSGAVVAHFHLRALRRHSAAVGRLAGRVAEDMGLKKPAAMEARAAGLLHDIGKLVLITTAQRRYAEVYEACRRDKQPLYPAEAEAFGADHAAMGAGLMILWGLPPQITQAIRYHHQPDRAPIKDRDFVHAVYIANGLIHQQARFHDIHCAKMLDSTYLKKAGLWKSLPRWQDWATDICEREQ